MKVGIRYIVTKGSDDGTFEIGDHFVYQYDGKIVCYEARGWLNERDFPSMEYKIDKDYYNLRKKELEKEIKLINEYLEEDNE